MNNKRILELLDNDKETLAILLDEQLTILDNIADQLGVEFLVQFMGEEE